MMIASRNRLRLLLIIVYKPTVFVGHGLACLPMFENNSFRPKSIMGRFGQIEPTERPGEGSLRVVQNNPIKS